MTIGTQIDELTDKIKNFEVDRQNIIDLTEKVKTLEIKYETEQQSIFKKLGVWGGLIALLISILTGGFTIYDNFVLKPEHGKKVSLKELSGIVLQLAEINLRIIETQQKKDLKLLNNFIRAINAKKISLINRADEIAKEFPNDVGVSENIALAYEHINFGNNEMGLVYSEKAFKVAKNKAFKAEAKRYKARSLFPPSSIQNITEARKSFSEGIQIAKNFNSDARLATLLNLYNDWIVSEAVYNSCEESRKIWEELFELLETYKVPPEIQNISYQNVREVLIQYNKCLSNFESKMN